MLFDRSVADPFATLITNACAGLSLRWLDNPRERDRAREGERERKRGGEERERERRDGERESRYRDRVVLSCPCAALLAVSVNMRIPKYLDLGIRISLLLAGIR